jgi:RHS repeat-associated protein
VTYNFGYDVFGNIASEKITGVGMPARTVTTSWGARGQLPVRTSNPLGQASRYDWNLATGLPLSFSDPNGLSIRWEYDAHGRPVRELQPDGARSEWTFEACRPGCDARARYRVRQDELDASGSVQATMLAEVDQYDRALRVETSQPGGARSASSVDYDARGRVARRFLPHWEGATPPGYWSFEHDALGRLTGERLVGADGSVARSSEWRHDGLRTLQLDALGRSNAATRSAWGRLSEVVDALGGRTRYEYDAFGGLTLVRDASNNTVAAISFDARGRKTSVADMDRGTWAWTRNALGETVTLRDARGKLARYEYDPLGRPTRRTDADGASTWSWGAAAAKKNVGRLIALAGPGYSEALTYDGVGRPATHTITADATYRFDYAYNSLGLLDSITYPSAGAGNRFRVRHGYDGGRVSRIWNADAPGDSLWQLNAQDAAGNILDETLGEARVISGFSPVSGDLEYRQAADEAGATIQDLAYGWDAAGNLASRRDLLQGLVEEFRYDGVDRLLQSRRNGSVNLEVDYDAIGNIRRKSDVCPGTAPCYTYHAARKHAVVSAGALTYAYDANGNMTSRNGGAIAWNAANLPVSIAGASGNNSQLAYGPDGNRWRQVARDASVTETTIYASGRFEKVARGTATSWRHHVATPGGAAIHYRYGDGSPATTRYLTLDHIGSTDRILDGAGDVFLSESFSAFGARRRPDWTGIPTAADLARIAAATRDGFTGHEHLDNLGLIHMNGRVYDPALGRFISADPYITLPYDGQGLNRYSYALNNPLAFTDPSGYDPIPCLATQSGNCVQITVIAASWPSYLRASGGAHASEVASALERDPCGQNGNGSACSMQGIAMVAPATVVFTVGPHPDQTLRSGGRLDAVQGFAARVANLAISSSPIALLFGADPDFQYFREPGNAFGARGAQLGNVGYLAGGAAGVIRKGGASIFSEASSTIARSFQGRGRYPGIDRFRDITLKKGTILYAGYPGQSAFYTTASAMRRAGQSSSALFRGLQVAAHETRGLRVRAAAYEVMEESPAAFGLALANMKHGDGWLPQVVVPSYESSLRYLNDFPLGP